MINKFNKGFTLIELLVVIALLGVMSAIIIAALGSSRAKGQDSSIQATLANMRTQSEIYYVNTGNYGPLTGTAVFPDNGCDQGAAINTTIFGMAASTQGSLLNFLNDLKSKSGSTNVACVANPTSGNMARWAVTAKLKTNGGTADFWCVDSTGVSKRATYVTTTLDTPEEAMDNATGLCL